MSYGLKQTNKQNKQTNKEKYTKKKQPLSVPDPPFGVWIEVRD